ncbi:hypothetical protein [Paenibacillus sp. Soil724D2]|uniref:hypothetical protein n=1 Tax=Paenibacillus sp. (strain Soil724D2) TaxID=1736392 RepID=UPI00071392BC|nr:hypothetical protein [Paenibacillus sp. Soil724D2]KRE33297.1 hypothetical protein ASG85_13535 [Paenibacillus sp. Soil724D2]
MKKYLVGAVFGFCLSLGVGASAEVVSMVGKVVDGAFPVTVNGSKVEASAIVIEGTSYLPVRAMGDALNMNVSFDPNMGVELKQKEVATVAETLTPEDLENIRSTEAQYPYLQEKIAEAKDRAGKHKQEKVKLQSDLAVETDSQKKKDLQQQIELQDVSITAAETVANEMETAIKALEDYVNKIKTKAS